MGFHQSSLRVPAVLLQEPHLASAHGLDSRLSATEAPPLIAGPQSLEDPDVRKTAHACGTHPAPTVALDCQQRFASLRSPLITGSGSSSPSSGSSRSSTLQDLGIGPPRPRPICDVSTQRPGCQEVRPCTSGSSYPSSAKDQQQLQAFLTSPLIWVQGPLNRPSVSSN